MACMSDRGSRFDTPPMSRARIFLGSAIKKVLLTPVAYAAAGFKPENLNSLTTRVMDCVDRHNRPAHTFQLPDLAVDDSMSIGAISPMLPEAKKESVTLLKGQLFDARRRRQPPSGRLRKFLQAEISRCVRAASGRSAAFRAGRVEHLRQGTFFPL